MKRLVRGVLRGMGLEVRRIRPAGAPMAGPRGFSHVGEDAVIERHLAALGIRGGYCVDIAAGDGTTMSNSYALYRAGWRGVAVEVDSARFSRLAAVYADFDAVDLMKCKVTPENVAALLDAASAPAEFEFLNLDIDGYDYFVLEKILQHHRPRLICAEINEKIPPPLKFTVRWNPHYAWAGDHFYGASISKMHELTSAHHYALTELRYNSAFFVPVEHWTAAALTPEQAWRTGYRDMADRREKFPYNADMEYLMAMPAAEALTALRERFHDRTGMFDAYL